MGLADLLAKRPSPQEVEAKGIRKTKRVVFDKYAPKDKDFITPAFAAKGGYANDYLYADKLASLDVNTIDRARGALFGCAIGDAVGTTVEFQPPGSFEPVTDMIGQGPFDLPAGCWTDDTSMAMCNALSFVTKGKWDPTDCQENFCKWFHKGLMSPLGYCFDIGSTVRGALASYSGNRNKGPFTGGKGERAAGNGSLMRIVPVSIFAHSDLTEALNVASESSRLTHANVDCVASCVLYTSMTWMAINGFSKQDILSLDTQPKETHDYLKNNPLPPNIQAIADGNYKELEPPAIKGTGHVVRALEAALWAFNKTDNFKDGCLLAVNLGNDADTTAAIYGQLAGAFYGLSLLPEDWKHRVVWPNALLQMADGTLTAKL